MQKPEILAPAGSINALKAAVINGADAVYLGVGEFNARAKAENFSLENLKEWVDYAHLFGVKVYLALNILFYDNELDAAVFTAKSAIRSGVDAIILQDLALAERLKKETSAVLHASTQMGIHNVYGAIAAEKLGFSRIILSRETLLEDIKKIKQETSIEIETFVHGALCVAFSGNCYFSSLVSGNSGNRGKCMQLCRKKYRLTCDSTTKSMQNSSVPTSIDTGDYLLSAKDLCLIKNLRDLADAGVTSFKIEGRMRKPSYIAETVRIYRAALNQDNFTLQDEDYNKELSALKRVFNRGDYTTGHLFNATENTVFPFIQGHMGEKIGVISRINSNFVELSCVVNKGDGLKFINKRGDVFSETGSALVQKSGGITGFIGSPKQGDGVYITSSPVKEEVINSAKRKINASFFVEILPDKPVTTQATAGDSSVTLSFDPPQRAVKVPLDYEGIAETFNKLGDTPFVAENIKTNSENAFLNKSTLNEIRRKTVAALQNKILENYSENRDNICKTPLFMSDIVPIFPKIDKNTSILFIDETYKSLSEIKLKKAEFDGYDYICINPKDYSKIDTDNLPVNKNKLILNLPIIARGGDLDVLKKAIENFDIIMVNNLYGVALSEGKKIILGSGMNLINNYFALPKVMSVEYKGKLNTNSLKLVGSPPLMTFCHCLNKTLSGCKGCGAEYRLTDDKNTTFRLRRYKLAHCYAQLTSDDVFVNAEKTGHSDMQKGVFIKTI